MQRNESGKEAIAQALAPRAQELQEALARGDLAAASSLIRDLTEQRDLTLYQEVGKLTRALHNALQNFHLDIGQGFSQVKDELSELVDARSRLDYVIRLTEDAANQTMDRIDESLPVAQKLEARAGELAGEWDHYREQTTNPQLHDRITALLEETSSGHRLLQDKLNEIMVAQGFQDLSGQVIKRVISLVNEVESNLVRLVRIAGSVEAVAGLEHAAQRDASEDERQERRIRAEGPQTGKAGGSGNDVVSGQDDVDDLLSSLGF